MARASTTWPNDCPPSHGIFERVAHPSVDDDGRRTPALRFGDPRLKALAGALCQTLLAATGFTSKNLRVLIAGLLRSAYTPGQITHDLTAPELVGQGDTALAKSISRLRSPIGKMLSMRLPGAFR